jgi:transposase
VVSERLLAPAADGKRPRLMFQDEARFGRMAKPKRCWAPRGMRPVMPNGYEREFTYVYGAVSPLEGEMEYCICDKMNTENMGVFLTQVSERYPDDYVLMVVDGASSHKAKALAIPSNISLITLPPYAPQLNPQEHVWDELREKNFPNKVFSTMEDVLTQLKTGLQKMCANAASITALTAWPWIRLISF